MPVDPSSQPDSSKAAKRPAARIGELLVKEKFITSSDCQRILAIQENEKDLTGASRLFILEKTGLLSAQERERILLQPDIQEAICQRIIKAAILTADEIDTALATKNVSESIITALGWQKTISSQQINDLIYNDHHVPQILSQAKKMLFISDEDEQHASRIQQSPRNFGEICCDLGLITPLDFYHVLNKHNKQTRLGETLVRLGHTNNAVVKQALSAQKSSDRLLGDILTQNNMVTSEQCQEALALQANTPFKLLETFTYDSVSRNTLPRLISYRYAEKNLLLPLAIVDRELTLAIMQPDAIQQARELIRLYKKLHIKCILTTEQRFTELFRLLYSKDVRFHSRETWNDSSKDDSNSPSSPETDFMQIELDEDLDESQQQADYGYSGQNIETEELVNYILKYGIKNQASDIHIEQDRLGVALRFRIDGVMEQHSPTWLQRRLQESPNAVISRIKVMSNLDIAEKRLPQDGVFRINYFDKKQNSKHDLDFRVATCPAITGENVTIRILDSRKASIGLDNLGHLPHVLDPFQRHLMSAAGIILVTGPTGSGKTSTLYGALQEKYDPSLKIITAEDPIEYSFPGIMQTQVNQKINLSFARLLRSFLRLDPDVILVGEIRDKETARIAFDAAQTGHLVLSTVHTNDSISTLNRLFDLQIDRSQITSSLSCVLAQRLVRRICPVCLKAYEPKQQDWSLLFNSLPEDRQFFQGAGCDTCNFSGFKGRTLLSEIFVMEDPEPILQGASVQEIRQIAQDSGMINMLEDGLMKLNDTTLNEICRVLPFEMLNNFQEKNK